jgi:hypothetical protein
MAGMTKKNAEQLAQHIKHQAPTVFTKIYHAFEDKRHGYGVQVSYGNKPDYVSCLNPKDWKEQKDAVITATV